MLDPALFKSEEGVQSVITSLQKRNADPSLAASIEQAHAKEAK